MKQRAPRPSNAPVTSSTMCQRCLQSGHWTADCKNDYAYKPRPSRTALLNNPKLALFEKKSSADEFKTTAQIEAEQRKVLEEVLGKNDNDNGDDDHKNDGKDKLCSELLSESDFSE